MNNLTAEMIGNIEHIVPSTYRNSATPIARINSARLAEQCASQGLSKSSLMRTVGRTFGTSATKITDDTPIQNDFKRFDEIVCANIKNDGFINRSLPVILTYFKAYKKVQLSSFKEYYIHAIKMVQPAAGPEISEQHQTEIRTLLNKIYNNYRGELASFKKSIPRAPGDSIVPIEDILAKRINALRTIGGKGTRKQKRPRNCRKTRRNL